LQEKKEQKERVKEDLLSSDGIPKSVIAKQRVLEINQGSVSYYLNDMSKQNTNVLNEKVGELEKLEMMEMESIKKL
jgi:hypothetical protein